MVKQHQAVVAERSKAGDSSSLHLLMAWVRTPPTVLVLLFLRNALNLPLKLLLHITLAYLASEGSV